jgi:L-galactose dehydrogenase
MGNENMIAARSLGRTGLVVSTLGLGGGGNSRLGLSTGQDEDHAADIVRAALDLGITMIDTALAYDTECAVGQALKGRRREQVVLSSKSPYRNDADQLLTPQAFQANLETSLRQMDLEMVDIYFIHGVQPQDYLTCRDRFLPVLDSARQAGKIRFIGLTEAFQTDTYHEMLVAALQEDIWDIVMVGFNFLNPSARQQVLVQTREKGVGTLGMYAVRRALRDETWLRSQLVQLAAQGAIDPGLATAPDLMAALGLRGSCETLAEAAYRFAVYEPGLDCILSGTSSIPHLQANLDAIRRGPLPEPALDRLKQLFGGVDSVSGQVVEM